MKHENVDKKTFVNLTEVGCIVTFNESHGRTEQYRVTEVNRFDDRYVFGEFRECQVKLEGTEKHYRKSGGPYVPKSRLSTTTMNQKGEIHTYAYVVYFFVLLTAITNRKDSPFAYYSQLLVIAVFSGFVIEYLYKAYVIVIDKLL